jgi:CBS domain-containing protein
VELAEPRVAGNVGYIKALVTNLCVQEIPMKVSDILRVKGGTLYTITPEDSLADAAALMAERDIGSLVVISYGKVVGMLTFREVIEAVVKNGGSFGTTSVYRAMDPGPLTCTMETEMDEVRRMMLDRHARYMPVINQNMLMGVVSFYDVARAVVDSQNFENKMLKAYIRDWPEGDAPAEKA